MVYMISPFQFIINNNTQVTTWRNPLLDYLYATKFY